MANWLRLKLRSSTPRPRPSDEVLLFADDTGALKTVDEEGTVAPVAGAGSLPNPTDDGDVLTVVSGDWAGAAPSGGSITVRGLAAPIVDGVQSLICCTGYRGIIAIGLEASESELAQDTFSGVNFDTDTDVFSFWFVPTPLVIASFKWKIAAGAGAAGAYRLALYEADEAWQPSELVWQSAEQDSSVEAIQSDAEALTLQGLYLVAMCANATAIGNDPTINYGSAVVAVGAGVNTPDLETETANPSPARVSRARAYGAFPDPGDPWDTVIENANTGIAKGMPLFVSPS